MLYGYASRKVNEYGLLELREVTFAAPPEVLREIAAFLEHAATRLEAEKHSPMFHVHIGSVVPGWTARFQGKDVIVMRPPDPPDD